MYSLLLDDLCWLLIGYSLLDALFLIWLFPCLVVLRLPGITIWLLVIFITFFTIGISLLSVLTYARSPNLAFCILARVKAKMLMFLILLCIPCFSKFFIQVQYHHYILHCRMFALTIYHRYFAKIFVYFMWFSVKKQKKQKTNSIPTLLAGNTQYILLGLPTFAYITAWLTVSCLFYGYFGIQYTVTKNIWTYNDLLYFLSGLSTIMVRKGGGQVEIGGV